MQQGISARSQLITTEKMRKVIHRFTAWLDGFGPTSQDPYDFWASSLGRHAKSSYYHRRWWGALAVAPFVFFDTFMPFSRSLASPRRRYPIADAHFAMGFFALAKAELDIEWFQRAEAFLSALIGERCKDYTHYCWGYPFDWETSAGTWAAGTPLITTTPYAYEALEAGYEVTRNNDYLRIMESVGTFAYQDLVETELSPGVRASSYTPFDHGQVVNASAYRAFLLMSAGQQFGREDWLLAANHNLAFVLQSQQADGSWLYAMDDKDSFIDNFHTCFVLKNLYKIWQITLSSDASDAIKRGYQFYKQHLLDDKKQPIPFARAQRLTLYRRDLYDYAEGINLALMLREFDADAPVILARLLEGLLEEWVLPDGHFVTRKMVIGSNTVPYHRWAQSQLFRALAFCYAAMR